MVKSVKDNEWNSLAIQSNHAEHGVLQKLNGVGLTYRYLLKNWGRFGPWVFKSYQYCITWLTESADLTRE
jgi:hypothetical protein